MKKTYALILAIVFTLALFSFNPPTAGAASAVRDPLMMTQTISRDFVVGKDGSLWRVKFSNRYNSNTHNYEYVTNKELVTKNVKSVFGDNDSQFIILNDNSLWAMGSNSQGRLGDNTGVDRKEPVKIMDNVREVIIDHWTGTNLITAIKTDDTAWRWGDGNYAPVFYRNNIKKIFIEDTGIAGRRNIYAIKTDNALWLLARSENETDKMIFDNVKQFAPAGYSHINRYIVTQDNILYGNGSGDKGQLGLGKGVSSTDYVQIASDVAYAYVGTTIYTSDYVLFIKTDGSLWGLGGNSSGQLGDGTKIDKYSPVKLMDNVTGVANYQNSMLQTISVVVKGDNTLWRTNSSTAIFEQVASNVAFFQANAVFGFTYVKNDGTFWQQSRNSDGTYGGGTDVLIHESVKLPQSLAFNVPPIKILFNGEYLSLDQPPVVENGRTLVPVKFVGEALGATVNWAAAERKVIITKDASVIQLTIDSDKAIVDGKEIKLDAPARIIGGRTMVPARFVSEAFGAKVNWDGAKREVIITTG